MTTSNSVASVEAVQELLRKQQYVADRPLALTIFLALKLHRPLFLEGEAGVGKTEIARALAAGLGTDLIRLQCYEGLDVTHAVYEWDYARQLLEIRMAEATERMERGALARQLFSEAFLIKRPLLQAIERSRERPPVLLIDELDRADEEFEGFLLEFLADFQVTVPELGTLKAEHPPVVVITSNRTREVHDALKRRCLYFWIDYPDFNKELQIITTKVPDASRRLAEQVTSFVQELRQSELFKVPGVAESLDWIAALVALNERELTPQVVEETMGALLKYREDLESVRGEVVQGLLNRAGARGVRRGGQGP
jgi:MoxR-like ATPase